MLIIGTYRKPTFYTQITSSNNTTILSSNQKTTSVVSKDVASVLKQLLLEPVNGANGTANYCKISGHDVAAKTGTTNENYDRWLCGFSSYYTAVCWYGFDNNESIDFNGKNPAGLMWADAMQTIHSKLPNSKFEITKGVTAATVCKDSGMLSGTNCPHTYVEYYLSGTAPSDICLQHNSY